MSHDTIVVGAGLAGLTAALRLAEAGRRVLVLAKGVGATHLSPATIDVLGYGDGRVRSPARALPELVSRQPEHPYARLPPATVTAAIDWLASVTAPLGYAGGIDTNLLLPTPIGGAKPTAAAPETMRSGNLRFGGQFLLVGFRALKDFYPALVAANLGRAREGVTARAVELQLDDVADISSLGLARRFDDEVFRAQLAAQLRPRLEPRERVGLPAVLGLEGAPAVWRELQERLETEVFEIPTLPPSVTGIRLYEALRTRFRSAGGRMIVGGPVIGAETRDSRVDAVVVQAAARPNAYRAGSYVLATGGFASGGIELDSRGEVRETVFGLPVAGLPQSGRPRFSPGLFDEQPLAKAGIAVDSSLRPLGADGRPVYENLYAAGATLAGAEPWREASGNGIALTSGYAAASAILAESS